MSWNKCPLCGAKRVDDPPLNDRIAWTCGTNLDVGRLCSVNMADILENVDEAIVDVEKDKFNAKPSEGT